MSHTLEGLRMRLFEAIDAVKAGTVTVEQARMIGELSQVIVNTAKVEVDYRRLQDKDTTSPFLSSARPEEHAEIRELPNGVVRVVQHTLRG